RIEHHGQDDEPAAEREVVVVGGRGRVKAADTAGVGDGGEAADGVAQGQQRRQDGNTFHGRHSSVLAGGAGPFPYWGPPFRISSRAERCQCFVGMQARINYRTAPAEIKMDMPASFLVRGAAECQRKDDIPRLIVPKNATMRQIYAVARKAFTAADLQKF